MVRRGFHRLVLRDGSQSSHLTGEESEAHRGDGFHPHCSGYMAEPAPRTRSEKATWKLSLTKGPSRMFSHVFSWS